MVARANNRHFGEGIGGEQRFEGPENPVQDGRYVDKEFFVLEGVREDSAKVLASERTRSSG